MYQPPIIVYENSTTVGDAICDPMVRRGFRVTHVLQKGELTADLNRCRSDLVILGPSVAYPANVPDLVASIREVVPRIAVLLITSASSEELAIAALRAGVDEYIKYPFQRDEVPEAVRKCLLKNHMMPGFLPDSSDAAISEDGFVGESGCIRDVRSRIARMAASDSNVLITGETGTGKELVAEMVHRHSRRQHRSFITINCAAIPDGLLESELFGYERGAFTGAQARQEGKLKEADGGSVFLDEIGDMSAFGQAKILRMIDSKEIQRLGKNGNIPVDVRIIAATNQDLESMVGEAKFRKDLFFRLNVARIHLPPLRERKEDLLYLIDHYLHHFNVCFGRNVERLPDEVFETLFFYDWPGNVRELKNLLEAVFVELPADDSLPPQLPPQFRRRCAELKAASGDERQRLLWALSMTNWNKSRAADKLQWSRMTLYRKMARYKIS
jgi:DNA-binding NtrC family response regulator